MITGLISWSLRNRLLVLLTCVLLAAWGVYSANHMALDAIPDLSDTQVIVKTAYPGQSPQTVEDQVTYPLVSALLSVPDSTAVRGFSMFGESYIYIIFKDGTDPYWARSRVLEYLSQTSGRLPPGVSPSLGPDASGLGWVFEYALVDRHHKYDPDQLRAVQDFFLKYELQSVPGVAEVASIGGMVRQFQIEVNPNRLAAYRLTPEAIANAVRDNNASGGGSVMEMAQAEYMLRTRGYLKSLDDLRQVPVGKDEKGFPVRLQDVATVQTGPELRRGVADLNGEGDVTGGVVIMRYGHNALKTLAAVKERLDGIKKGLPPGVELVVTYDRSQLITEAVDNLQSKLLEESLVVGLVCLLFLFHFRSSLVAIVTLPVAILFAFIIMKHQGVSANIMSLGGIAIAIGAMVDAAVVMIENMHKHLERAGSNTDYWEVARTSATEVGPSLFFSLLIITISFLPVFTLAGQEGKLFGPLAYTKTYAMAAAAILAVTLIPVLMGYFIRGHITPERQNPLNRFLQALYRPALLAALNRPKVMLISALVLLLSAIWPIARIGAEFMPPLYEGSLLYMPTTLPGVSVGESAHILQVTDRLIRQLPEVAQVFGKAGRAETATDPAPLSMLETTILLKPRSEWPEGETVEQLMNKLDQTVRLPGLTNSWGYPIRTRIDMLSTGIRTPLGIKITGPDLDGIASLATRIEAVLKELPGTRGAFGERAAGGRYIDIDINRAQAARYGVSVADMVQLIQGAIGGENIDTLIDGRERFPINLRYPRAFRDSLESLGNTRITTPSGIQVPLRQIARISVTDGPAEIKSENGRLVGYVYIDITGQDLGSYVDAARHAVGEQVSLEPGYALEWSGQYQNMQHAKERLLLVVPLTLLLTVALLYANFRDWVKVLLVAISLPFSLVGGLWLLYLLGYNFSVAVAVGFIALAGVAIEFGVVMLLYLDNAVSEIEMAGKSLSRKELYDAIIKGALLRIRPKVMTVGVIVTGLVPIMLSEGAGSDVMKRIAAPLVGGMVTAPLLSLLVIPVLYWIVMQRKLVNR